VGPPGWNPGFASSDPRFASIAAAARAFEDEPDWPAVERWNALLARAGLDPGVAFVPQRGPLRRRGAERAPYDRQIAAGRVPSRDRSWHDFLNMLVWASFPRTKAAIHARHVQAADLRERGIGGNRGPERDALAMLDEGGALVVARPGAREVVACALASREAGGFDAVVAAGDCVPRLVGHGIMETLLADPAADLFAAALVVEAPAGDPALVDAAAGERIARAREPWHPGALGRLPVRWIEAQRGRRPRPRF
jgi:hypothetical protein